jgi:hypothetical protein
MSANRERAFIATPVDIHTQLHKEDYLTGLKRGYVADDSVVAMRGGETLCINDTAFYLRRYILLETGMNIVPAFQGFLRSLSRSRRRTRLPNDPAIAARPSSSTFS